MLALLLFATAFAPEEVDVDDIPEAPKPCTVEWGSKEYPDFVKVTEPRIHRRCRDLAAVLSYEGPPESIHVDISGKFLEFRVRVSITNDGELLHDGEPSDACDCGADELATLAMKQVVEAIETIRTPEETPPPEQPRDQPPKQVSQPTPPPVKHTLRWVGLGVGLAGAGALAAGVPLHLEESRSEAPDPRGLGENVRRRDRALTVPLIVGGAVGIIAGAALIVSDAVKTKKAKRTTLTPSVSPSWAGLSIQGRF